MALEQRNGQSYYYRHVRDGEKVRKKYVASGEIAQTLARTDELIRQQRQAKAAREREEREHIQSLVAPTLELEEAAQVLTRAHLVAGGYRRVKGEWRMPRGG